MPIPYIAPNGRTLLFDPSIGRAPDPTIRAGMVEPIPYSDADVLADGREETLQRAAALRLETPSFGGEVDSENIFAGGLFGFRRSDEHEFSLSVLGNTDGWFAGRDFDRYNDWHHRP